MYHRSRGATDDGTVRVWAACGLLTVPVEALAVEVRGEHACLHVLVRLSAVGGLYGLQVGHSGVYGGVARNEV